MDWHLLTSFSRNLQIINAITVNMYLHIHVYVLIVTLFKCLHTNIKALKILNE